MATPKVLGIETEYGILARGVEMTAMLASSLLVNAYTDEGLALRAWDFADETPSRDQRDGWHPEREYPEVEVLMANSILTNGARFYVDHAHPEISTPECRTPSEVVLYDRAAEEIIRSSLVRANERLGAGVELLALKNNSDGKGNSYGCHENYLVSRDTAFGYLARALTSHFVTRQIFCGAGKVGVENPREGEVRVGFQISQRADFFEEEVGLETTVRRPIINTRDEPHCDPARFRRLHVIVGDANMSECATFAKVGTTALVLAAVEDGLFPEALFVEDPVASIRRVSHDVTLRHAVVCADGTARRALDVQYGILSAVRQWWNGADADPTGGEGEVVLRVWGELLDGLATNPASVSNRVDWVAKQVLVEGMRERHDLHADHPRLKAIDLQYHDMRPSKCLASKVGLLRMVDDAAVAEAVSTPPTSTRAWFRGECIRRWPANVVSANWDSIVFDVGDPVLMRVPMMDPLKGTKAHVGALLDTVSDVAGLLAELGSNSVEEVHADPGW